LIGGGIGLVAGIVLDVRSNRRAAA